VLLTAAAAECGGEKADADSGAAVLVVPAPAASRTLVGETGAAGGARAAVVAG
jgi:hypothetical protein